MEDHRPSLLVVDDDRAILSLIGGAGSSEGFDVATTDDVVDALLRLLERPADLVLLDLRPGVTSLDVLRSIRHVNSQCKVVLMTAFGSMDKAVEAVKLGAIDYLTKPFELSRLRQLLRDVRSEAEQRRAVLSLERDVAERLEFCGMIGRGPAMQDMFSLVRRLAPHASTVLVSGEAGSGKELVARALHHLGPRRQKRFIAVNCSGAAETLVAGELFGHVRGAVAGATGSKPGLLESADGGTIFLDDIARLPLPVQARLLRVLEDGEVQRIGSVQARRVNVGVIAATNCDLGGEVAAGRFCRDLYYRLRAVEIAVPPLRDRREDIPYLTAAFIRAFSQRFDKPLVGPAPDAERLLAESAWDGNVRQLRNVLERACIVADSDYVTASHLIGIMREQRISRLTAGAAAPGARGEAAPPLRGVDREHIVRTLRQVRGNKAVAARLLGISRRAFYRQLERHGLHQRIPAQSRVRAGAHYDVEQV